MHIDDAKNRKEMILLIREEYQATHQVFFLFDDCRLALGTNSAGLAEELRRYFGAFCHDGGHTAPDIEITAHEAPPPSFSRAFIPRSPDPGKRKIKEEYLDVPGGRVVRKRLTGMVFFFGGADNTAIGPCLANTNQVVNFINNRFISWKLKQGCLLGHAAAVSIAGAGLGLAGFSGMGKSTLALHLMSRGATFVSNDRLLVRLIGGALSMCGVAKLPRINPGTALNNPDLMQVIPRAEREDFARLAPESLWDLEHKYDVPVDACFGRDRFQLLAAMEALLILNWQRNGQPLVISEVDLAERPDLLPAFMKSTGLFHLAEEGEPEPLDPGPEAYADLLGNCRVFEATGGVDFDKAADACLTILSSRQSPGR